MQEVTFQVRHNYLLIKLTSLLRTFYYTLHLRCYEFLLTFIITVFNYKNLLINALQRGTYFLDNLGSIGCKVVCFSAQVVKLVDTPDLGSGAVRCVGSSPILGTLPKMFSEMTMFSAFLFYNAF